MCVVDTIRDALVPRMKKITLRKKTPKSSAAMNSAFHMNDYLPFKQASPAVVGVNI